MNPVKIGRDAGGVLYNGLALFGVPCNRYATIASATLTLDLSGGTMSSPFFEIYCFFVDADNQGWTLDGFEATLGFSHNLTTGAGPVAPVSGVHAYDVTAALQQVVNRVGWVPGNFAMAYITWNGTGYWANMTTTGIYTPNGPPQLDISWSGGDGGGGGSGGGGGGGQSGVNGSFLLGAMLDGELL